MSSFGKSLDQDQAIRILTAIRNVEEALNSIDRSSLSSNCKEIIDIVEAYVKDSRYYLSVNDLFTALAAISYAEGLLDALRLLGVCSFTWKRPSQLAERARTKVLTAGTFEILHPGHIEYLRYAWSIGRVITVVSRDRTVVRIKGREPVIPEDQRLDVVKSITYVHKARLGYEDDMFRVIEEERPDVILLGPNQPFREDDIRRELRRRGLENVKVVRMSYALNGDLYSTTKIIQRIIERHLKGRSIL